MGYYADVSGYIDFMNPLPQEKMNRVVSILEQEYYVSVMSGNIGVDFYADDKYYRETQEMLDDIAKEFLIKEGNVECHGEDDEHWCFRFERDASSMHGKFVEYAGKIVYGYERQVMEDSRMEFVGQLIDVFEDFLDEKKIVIPNEDKEQSGDDCAANIYGMDYGIIQNGIEAVLRNWNIIA